MVLARAAENAAKASPALADAEVRLDQHDDGWVLNAVYTMAWSADPVAAMALVEQRLIPDLEEVLGVPFVQRHVRFAVASGSALEPRGRSASLVSL
ncbi:hypothetical protein [Arthrobacter sp. RAF14]|uniref:hypothetical protein n=1 Tax=Arthrobacter sp. RAF14 TaxID=3233051 RepID=UPI003F8FD3C3